MPRVRKYHGGGKGPGHPHSILSREEKMAADREDWYDRYPQFRPEAQEAKRLADAEAYYKRYPDRTPDAIAKRKAEQGTIFGSAADFFQYTPFAGEIIDLLNIPYVFFTGKDIYNGNPQSVESAAAWGIGGLLLPNLIEKPAKWLIKQGAKNADDVASILRSFSNRNAADIPADLKPLLDFSKKNNEMRDFLYAKTDTFPFAGMDDVGSNRLKDVGGDLHSYIVKNRPDLINKFSIENFENGMFDEVTRAWGDEYLVSLRGVRDAKNVDEAAEFLTSSKGGGERVQGPGINTSGSLNQVEPFGSGSEGYVGRIKVNEPYSSSANASTILDNIYNLEKEGGKLIPTQVSAGGVNYESLSRDGIVDGINTIDETSVRVIKENTPVTLEDIIKTEGNDISNVLRNSSETTLDWTKNPRNNLNELYNTILKTDYKQGGAIKGLVKKYHEGTKIHTHTDELLSLIGSNDYNKEDFQKFREENDIYDEGAIDRVKKYYDAYYSNPDVLRRLTEQYQSTQDKFKGETMGPHYDYDPPWMTHTTYDTPYGPRTAWNTPNPGAEEEAFDREQKMYDDGIAAKNLQFYSDDPKYNLPPEELAKALIEYRRAQVGNTHYEATEETWLDDDGHTYGRETPGRKLNSAIYDNETHRMAGAERLIMGLPRDFQERINKVQMARYSPNYESATAHETSHSLDQVQGRDGNTNMISGKDRVESGMGLSEGESQAQTDAIISNRDSWDFEGDSLDSGNQRDAKYVLGDSELRARIGTLRYNLSKTGDDVFNELSMENIEAIKRTDPEGYKRLSLYLDDESIINLLNTQFKDGGKVKKYAADGIKVPEGKPNVNELLDMLSQHKGAPQKELNQFDSEEKWVPRREDIYKYLTSRGIDSGGNEISKTRIIAGPVAEHGEKPSDPASPGISIKDEDGKVKIKVASGDIENPTTRIEESIHSLQQQTLNNTSLSRVGGNKRRLYRMMKKQPWLNDLSPEKKKSLTKGNYVFKGEDSNQEFEAKLIAAKMTMMHEGILSDDGVVSENDLEAIKQWYEKRKTQGNHGWESVLFQDLSDKKYRNEMLNTLNKL
tara:strand:- start:703 stop:3909 length:3207 start_codon:yes stop_codon:yes gene_type:complete